MICISAKSLARQTQSKVESGDSIVLIALSGKAECGLRTAKISTCKIAIS